MTQRLNDVMTVKQDGSRTGVLPLRRRADNGSVVVIRDPSDHRTTDHDPLTHDQLTHPSSTQNYKISLKAFKSFVE